MKTSYSTSDVEATSLRQNVRDKFSLYQDEEFTYTAIITQEQFENLKISISNSAAQSEQLKLLNLAFTSEHFQFIPSDPVNTLFKIAARETILCLQT